MVAFLSKTKVFYVSLIIFWPLAGLAVPESESERSGFSLECNPIAQVVRGNGRYLEDEFLCREGVENPTSGVGVQIFCFATQEVVDLGEPCERPVGRCDREGHCPRLRSNETAFRLEGRLDPASAWLEWNEVAGATHYEVWVYHNDGSKWRGQTVGTGLVLSELGTKKVYWAWVEAWRGDEAIATGETVFNLRRSAPLSVRLELEAIEPRALHFLLNLANQL